ncbi:MAG: aminoacyl-tRNA hydrolase [Dehalococcoidales bacterium]|jgi:PTH1 family peptidyl-tRNA hydrolase|nr:aminoacyl-tRNA hydrolase [Dehalococcoidales bacterium]MDD3994501.1 aminoacyl-tRNA hydrolase [Dehalococcoidales bacterium]NLT28555.1 aminoacyl-tRNA hydrolase [Dehalococcoidales bacterium]
MKLIVGLGNPGQGYSNNRHNIGFICLKHFSKEHKITFDKKQADARIGRGNIEGLDVVLAKPQTYMNLSGKSVNRLMQKYKLKPEDIIVIHDDMDLPLGKVRIRMGGSSGGHKGINSIIAEVGTREFIRIKVGIGRPEKDEEDRFYDRDIVDYVLSNFSRDEKKQLEPSISKVSNALLCLITEGLEPAMNKFN